MAGDSTRASRPAPTRVGDDHDRTDGSEHGGRPVRRLGRADRHVAAIGLVDAEQDDQIVDAAAGRHGHGGVDAHAHLTQPPRDMVGALVKLGIADPGDAIVGGAALRVTRGGMFKRVQVGLWPGHARAGRGGHQILDLGFGQQRQPPDRRVGIDADRLEQGGDGGPELGDLVHRHGLRIALQLQFEGVRPLVHIEAHLGLRRVVRQLVRAERARAQRQCRLWIAHGHHRGRGHPRRRCVVGEHRLKHPRDRAVPTRMHQVRQVRQGEVPVVERVEHPLMRARREVDEPGPRIVGGPDGDHVHQVAHPGRQPLVGPARGRHPDHQVGLTGEAMQQDLPGRQQQAV